MNLSKTKLVGIIACSILFGAGIGGLLSSYLYSEDDTNIECGPGTYIDGCEMSAILMTVGAHALNDGLYDTYELNQMLENSTIY